MTTDHPFGDSPRSSETTPLRPWTLRILLWLIERKLKRKVRSDKGTMRHTERDLWAMRWVGEQAAVRFDHVRQLLGRFPQGEDTNPRILSENAARHVIERWRDQGYARFEPILAREPGWLWLTKAGLHEAGLQMTYYKPAAARVGHLHLVNWVRLSLEKGEPDARWKSEREIRAEMEKSRKSRKQKHVPDAWHFRPGATGAWKSPVKIVAIELEITAKSRSELFPILQSYSSLDVEVWYYGTHKVEKALRRDLALPALRDSRGQYRFLSLDDPWEYPPPLLYPGESSSRLEKA
jgi:hypothetical protein